MSLPYPTDPSLPSNPAPLFSDSTAARGDHLRANNAEIWANFTDINDHASRYDYVIDSQDKFDALVASGTWLNAKNVLFTTNVTRAAQTTIPATVEKILAINGATLTATNLTSGQYGFGYATVPTDTKFEIRNFAVNATGTGTIHGFYSCTQVTNCTATGTGTDGYGYGYRGCCKCMCNKAGGNSTTATYNVSYADAGTSNACADTAAGGYNS